MNEKKFPKTFAPLPKIHYMSSVDFSLNYREEWHNSHYNDLIYLISGSMTIVMPGVKELEFPVNQGELFLMRSNVKHKDIFKLRKGLKALVISYLWKGDEDFLPPETPFRKFASDELLEVRWILERIRENCIGKNPKSKFSFIQQSRLHTILLLLFNQMNDNFIERQDNILGYGPESLLQAAQYYIQCNYATPKLNRTQVANALSVSVATLTRAFDRCSAYSFVEYLTSVRLEAAQRMLRNRSCRVSEAAANCGFTDAGYFARVFKKAFGVSPIDFR